jgi:hypothetical protein
MPWNPRCACGADRGGPGTSSATSPSPPPGRPPRRSRARGSRRARRPEPAPGWHPRAATPRAAPGCPRPVRSASRAPAVPPPELHAGACSQSVQYTVLDHRLTSDGPGPGCYQHRWPICLSRGCVRVHLLYTLEGIHQQFFPYISRILVIMGTTPSNRRGPEKRARSGNRPTRRSQIRTVPAGPRSPRRREALVGSTEASAPRGKTTTGQTSPITSQRPP